jgi:hypothetical protein
MENLIKANDISDFDFSDFELSLKSTTAETFVSKKMEKAGQQKVSLFDKIKDLFSFKDEF